MKTKSVWMVASLAALCAASHSDEKAKEAAVKPVAASDYAPFVVPVPKDESGFATKPPEGGAILIAPDLSRKGPVALPPTTLHKKPPQTPKSFLKMRVKELPLSYVLLCLADAHRIKIETYFSPEEFAEDPKITMTIRGMSIEESFNDLKVLGLVWRKSGDTYFVAWSENDLPPLQTAITPAPQ